MAAIVNDRDALMQATSPRYTSGGIGQKNAVVYIYQRSASATAPTLPSAACTYTFATGGLTGLDNGWSNTFPSGTQKYLHVSMVTVSSTGATATIPAPPATGSWNTPALLSSNGDNGVAAYVILSQPSLVFSRANAAAAFAPTSITLTATPFGGSATYTWSYWTGSAWSALTGTAATYTVASGDFTSARTFRVSAVIGGVTYTDEVTLAQLTGGTDGATSITGLLTNPAATLPADSSGVVSNFAPAGGTFKVWAGIVDKTGTAGPVTYATGTLTGCTASINTTTGVYSVTAMSADAATAVFTATYGGVTIPLTLSLSKARAGANGSDGSDGNDGSDGSNGPRGSITTAYTSYPYTYWQDSYANQALQNLGYYDHVVGDIVTLAAASGYAETRFYTGSYSGGSYWVALDVYINGNMLVEGTFAADKIAAGSTLSGVYIVGGSLNIGSGTFLVSGGGVLTTNALCLLSSGASISGGTSFPSLTATSTNSFHAVWAQNSSTGHGLRAEVTGSSGLEAIYASNLRGGVSSHGIRGQAKSNVSGTPSTGVSGGGASTVTTSSITSGLVGAANGYDFYADGAGTNYGPFTGAHDVLWLIDDEFELGDIVIDVECVVRGGWSNTIFRTVRSSQPYQRGAVGVLAYYCGLLSDHVPAAFIESRQATVSDIGPSVEGVMIESIYPIYDQVKSLYKRGAANALGEGQLNVVGEGGDIAAGDLIVTSSIAGKGMRQADDLLRSYTVARAREACTFSTPGEIKTIACIYLCG